MSKDSLKNIEQKLDILINLTARQMIGDKSNAEAAPLLRDMGFQNKQIAEILGSTPSAVRNYISNAKKKIGVKNK